LETVSVTIPEAAVEAFEQALATACRTVGFFLTDEDLRIWTVEGVKRRGESEPELAAALAIASLITSQEAVLERRPTEAGGWLARTESSFPEQYVGRRFAVRGTHLGRGRTPGRITLVLDAGVAFGSGEHGSTRGCLRALERVAFRRPRRILDLGCGSGILAMAAAKLPEWRAGMPWRTGFATDCGASSQRDGSRLRGAARPMIWYLPTSSHGRCAPWRGIWQPMWHQAERQFWPVC
jgi:ribosomal protein L11 methyltransferase